MYTYISIVDTYIDTKMSHCMCINRTEQGNMHTRTQVQLYLALILSKTMRAECAVLCIFLVIMSSTLTSCYGGTYITSYVPTVILFVHGLKSQLWMIMYASSSDDDQFPFTWMHFRALYIRMLRDCH